MTNGISPDILKHSVTRDDHMSVAQGGAFLLQFTVPVYGPAGGSDLPAYWSPSRDQVLRLSIHLESMWGSALGKAITKIAAQGWEIADSDESNLRVKRGQDLYLTADNGAGWVTFISRHLRDFLTTDNGAFVEIVRASPAAGSKILGLMHLDSMRCLRTADPEIPVIYRDRMGGQHEMRAHEVLMFADMASPTETFNGVGFCATSRAYRTIYKLAAMELYGYEKVSGSGATSLEFVQGVTEASLRSALVTAENQQVAKGAVYYKGSIVIPLLGDTPPNRTSIPLKSMGDGFELEKERDNAYLVYANAIGIPVQDIKPLSGQGLGTGTQTVILAEAEEGQGLAAWRKQWEHAQNERVLPETTTFSWSTNDIRDQKSKADVSLVRAQARAAQVGSQEITPAQALQIAVDAGDVPREFLPVDQTPGGALDDTEKPLVDAGVPVPTAPNGTPLPAADPRFADLHAALARLTGGPAAGVPQIAAKARDPYADVAELLDEDEAVALADEVSDG